MSAAPRDVSDGVLSADPPEEAKIVHVLVPSCSHRYAAARLRDLYLDSVCPALRKGHAVYPVQKVDPVRRDPELEDRPGRHELAGIGNLGYVAVPELPQCVEEALGVLILALVENTDIAGQTRVAVMDDGFFAHHQVSHMMRGQEPQEVGAILGEIR